MSVLIALRRNVEFERNQNRKLHKCMQILRKYHTFLYFHRYRRIVHWEVAIKEKNSIQGAYLLLRRFKNRLKAFDSVIAKIETAKVNVNEFELLKRSLER